MAIHATQFTIDELLAACRRRRRLLVLPFLGIVIACTTGAFILPRKYQSSTTILVQRDEVLNPLINFTMAVSAASLDRLSSLNEIVFSQSTIDLLIDTTGLGKDVSGRMERENLVKEVRAGIGTERQGEESFTITYLDTDSNRAMAAVTFLANYFIRTRLQVEGQRNEYAVEFYEKKLEELKQKFEGSQKVVIATLRKRINEMPIEGRALYSRVDDVDQGIEKIDSDIRVRKHALEALREFPGAFQTDSGKHRIVELQHAEIPFAADLRILMSKYGEVTGRYTEKYPEVRKLEQQILGVLEQMRIAADAELGQLRKQRREMEAKRGLNVRELQHTSIAEKEDLDKTSNFTIFQNLYDEMKIKLEQARTSRDLAKKATNQFIIIDPPRVPLEPSKPNRLLIILGGIGLGLFVGILSAGIGELTDTRVRTSFDVEIHGKPILAYLPDATTGAGF
jgi:uncharacterized protein involved in exopolysaccharide biosynthesis